MARSRANWPPGLPEGLDRVPESGLSLRVPRRPIVFHRLETELIRAGRSPSDRQRQQHQQYPHAGRMRPAGTRREYGAG